MGLRNMKTKNANTKSVNSKGERKGRAKWLLTGLAVLIAVVFGYLYMNTKNELNRLSDPQAAAAEQTEKITAELGKLIELPENETPTVATIVDVEKLKDQPFFAKAQNGDRVIIYTQSRKAILYRPSAKKIIEVAPINIGDNQATSEATQQ